MKKASSKKPALDLEVPDTINFSKGVRGKYANLFPKGMVFAAPIEPDVAKAFPTPRAVNNALRKLMKSDQPRLSRRKAG